MVVTACPGHDAYAPRPSRTVIRSPKAFLGEKHVKTLLTVGLLFVLSAAPASAQPQTDEAQEARARQYATWLRQGEADALWAVMSEEMRALFGTPEAINDFRQPLGAEREVQSARLIPLPEGNAEYLRVLRYAAVDEPMAEQWSLSADGTVVGLLVQPLVTGEEAPSRFLDYQTKTALRLPFEGEWFVFWGGRDVTQNYHAASGDQRFAYDFGIVREGSSYRSEGAQNEDYYCFGAPVLAPGDGVVAAAVDGVPDQTPGKLDPKEAMGNHVVIDHGNGEFSFLAHLREGSVRVRPGASVTAGDVIGACGNSGNSSEPHLHYHLQTSAVPFGGEGLPAFFGAYLADGAAVASGEPTRGQFVAKE